MNFVSVKLLLRIDFDVTDLQSHIKALADKEELPTFEYLYARAQHLHQQYGTASAFVFAMNGDTEIKDGTGWTPPKEDKSSAQFTSAPASAPGKRKRGIPKEEGNIFSGDEPLARSTCLICDALLSRQAEMAVADGDVGCAWECLKVSLRYITLALNN